VQAAGSEFPEYAEKVSSFTAPSTVGSAALAIAECGWPPRSATSPKKFSSFECNRALPAGRRDLAWRF